MSKNYYKTLEVDSSASQEVIEKAYKALAKKYHPDLQEESQKEAASEKLKEINEAYEILSNPESRANFDKTLKASTISEEDFNKMAQENQILYNELNNLKNEKNNRSTNPGSTYNSQINYNTTQNSTNQDLQQQELAKQMAAQEAYEKELEYQEEMQRARQKAYHDAYIQDLKNRGYKIRYKKTPREIMQNFTALIITIFIVILICQIPFVKNFLHELYEENFFIKFIVDIFLNIFKMGAN